MVWGDDPAGPLLDWLAVPRRHAVSAPSGEPTDENANLFPAAPLATAEGELGAVRLEIRTAPKQPPERGVLSVRDGVP